MRFIRKKSKATGGSGRETCCTRLLWNSEGAWRDCVFSYQDGVLTGNNNNNNKNNNNNNNNNRDHQGVQKPPPEITIKISTSKLTVYGPDDLMRKLNLFKITTICNVAHMFAAWTEEEYDTWVDILTYAVGKKYEQVSMNMGADRCIDEECYDNDIIPYDEGTVDQRKLTGKRLTDSRGESIDSGNDGDESGLESSVSSLFESRRRLEMERKEFSRTVSHSSIPEINHVTDDRNSFIRCSSEKDIGKPSADRLHNRVPTNEYRTPTLQYQTYAQRENYIKNDKSRRPTSYPQSVDTNSEHQYRVPSISDHKTNLKVPTNKHDVGRKPVHPTYHRDDSVSSTPEYYVTADNNRHHSRQCSTDTYLHLNDVAIDATSQPSQITDTTTELSPRDRHPKVSVVSYNDDTQTTPSSSVVDVRHKLEESLREETLLKRRRNSLNLELDLMKGKLEELRDNTPSHTSHHHGKSSSKDNNSHNNNNNNDNNNNNNSIDNNSITEPFDRSKHIERLEKKAAHIENEIRTIDKRISVATMETPTHPTHVGYCNTTTTTTTTTEKKRKSSNIMKRLRSAKNKGVESSLVHNNNNNNNNMVHTCSMSVESLTSNASHDSSSLGRESPFLGCPNDNDRNSDVGNRNSDVGTRNSYIPTVGRVEERTDGCPGNQDDAMLPDNGPVARSSPLLGTSPSGLNGFETLLRTTQLLENGEFLTSNKRDSTSSNGEFLTLSKRNSTSSESDHLSMSNRSKSMSAMDRIKTDKSTTGGDKSTTGIDRLTSSLSTDSPSTPTTSDSQQSVEVIIEDFEKFSAMLMQTHQMKASGQIIDV